MFDDIPGVPFFTVLIALLPAALRWWWGRSLARLADDPAIAERLAAHRTRVQAATFACSLLLCIPWSSAVLWGLPLLLVASSAAGHSLRKALYNETWTRRQSVSFYVRLSVAALGFWVVLGMTPWVAHHAGDYEWIAGAALAAVLAAWNHYNVEVVLVALRAQTVTDATLNARFAALVARSGIEMPQFKFVDMRGGVLANAFALPSVRRPSVLFTDTLLSRLSTDEIIAIAAHELAHLEYYNRARLRLASALNYALIAGAALAAPLARLTVAATEQPLAAMLWPLVLVLTLVMRARHRQKNETASDLRAIELTGDPEALASALTALHVIARVPRRWDHRREQNATHPSLARRLRDIRAAAGVAAAPIDAGTPFRATSPEAIVVFEPARLNWQEATGATHLLDYSGLAELRLHASSTGAVTLVAVERQGRRWQMTPQAADIQALQSVLDAVDGSLTTEVKPNVFSATAARVATVLVAWLILVTAQVSVGLVALLAAINAGPTLLNAAGAAALVGAALVLRDGSSIAADSPFFAVLTACAGITFLALGWARRAVTSRFDGPLTAFIGVSAVLAVAATAVGGL